MTRPQVSREAGSTALVTGASALVSGATGFLGSRLVPALQEAGFRVRVLVRKTSQKAELLKKGVELLIGDLGDPASLQAAVSGQQYVFHTAGMVTDWGRRSDFFRINTDGTTALLEACQRASVERLIHVSSLTVLGLPRRGKPVDELSPYTDSPSDPYTASKMAAEKIILSARGLDHPEIVVIRPGVIWGKGDITIVPRLADLLKRGRLVYIGGAGNVLGMSHVDNLCQGIIQAAVTPGAAGQIYHLTDGEEITARQAIDSLARRLGVSPPKRSLPYWLLYAIAGMMEASARLTRRQTPPMLTRYGVRLVACDSRYDISKARRELNYQPCTDFSSGMTDLFTTKDPR